MICIKTEERFLPTLTIFKQTTIFLVFLVFQQSGKLWLKVCGKMVLFTFKCSFPDCVMVALQILVLTVGVRILLGEVLLYNKDHLRLLRISV